MVSLFIKLKIYCIDIQDVGTDTFICFQTDVVIKAGTLPVFPKLLRHHRSNIVKEAAWTISNITAGNVEQIQSVIEFGLIRPICEVLEKVNFITCFHLCY